MQDAESGGLPPRLPTTVPPPAPAGGGRRRQRFVEDLMGGVPTPPNSQHREGRGRAGPRGASLQPRQPPLRPVAHGGRGRLDVLVANPQTSRPPASTASSRRTTPSGCGRRLSSSGRPGPRPTLILPRRVSGLPHLDLEDRQRRRIPIRAFIAYLSTSGTSQEVRMAPSTVPRLGGTSRPRPGDLAQLPPRWPRRLRLGLLLGRRRVTLRRSW